MDDTVVLIPAYQPTENLTELAGSLYAVGFRIVVVDDGSGDEFSHIFEKTEAYATVIGYDDNKGKGYALRYGLSTIQKEMSYFKYIITVDSDGQHSEEAVKKVSDEIHKKGGIVMAERIPDKWKIPKSVRFCNNIISNTYSLLTGKYMRDTMSGLRAFEMSQIEWLSKVEGDTFDFEINALVEAAKRRYPIHTVRTEEIDWQITKKEASHYKVTKDLFLQMKALVKIGYPSLLSAFMNYVVVFICTLIFGKNFAGIAGAVIVGNLIGISGSVYLNNNIGYEENMDGALSYNRIIIGMLRFFMYFFLMELIGGLIGAGLLLSIVLTVVITTALELQVMKLGLDKDIRIINK